VRRRLAAPALSGLPAAARRDIGVARTVAGEVGERLFLAGGVVRDLLLGRSVRDVDLVVEGDAIAFARRLADRLGATRREHGRFATATLELAEGRRLDVAATRRERYARSGALPDVATGVPIEEDLSRRDFSINAMALALAKPPRLLDPLGGRDDLRRGIVRVLHDRSFADDPTRIFRAIRYATRLGFRLAPTTRRALGEAVADGALERISADRLRREIRLILEEPDRARAVDRMRRLGVAVAVRPILARPGAVARLRRAEKSADWLCYLRAWMGDAADVDIDGVASRLGLSRADRRRLRAAGRGPEELSVRGADLVAAGVPSGPVIGRALARTRAALEQGRLDPRDALAFALRTARGEEP
jgi:tRNA nucleotidyltransferase (CCA-adding enzyme)